jgi:hypothetical protein
MLPHVLLVFFIRLTTPFVHVGIDKPIPVFILATDTTKEASQEQQESEKAIHSPKDGGVKAISIGIGIGIGIRIGSGASVSAVVAEFFLQSAACYAKEGSGSLHCHCEIVAIVYS